MTSDVEVFHQIFVDGELEFDLHMLPSRNIDAGANIGLAAVYFSSRFPEAKILALEVEAANFELLRHNTAFYPNITCLKKALWSGPANLSIANPTAESMSFQVSPSAKGDEEGILAVGVKDLAEMFRGDGARPGVVGVGMSAVVLHLKREYWDAIRDGIKREEYRARGPYWGRRIRNKDFSEVILLCGYPKRGDDSLMIRRKWKGYRETNVTHALFGEDPVPVFAIDVSEPQPLPSSSTCGVGHETYITLVFHSVVSRCAGATGAVH